MDSKTEELLGKVRSEGGVEVMKASAGSGKTFSLAREYIRLLLLEKDPCVKAHRHILAVTFTNKATEEMKSRIVQDLDILAHDTDSSKIAAYLMKECAFGSKEELRKAADKALTDILTDYSAFSVSTIDKFFQQTLRAFAREIGQFAEYKVELDRSSLVSEAVDRVLDSLSENSTGLLKWLSDSSIEKIEAGEGYHLEANVNEFAAGYLSQEYKTKLVLNKVDEKKAFSAENISRLISTCRTITREFDRKFKDAVSAASEYFGSFPSSGIQSNLTNKLRNLGDWNGGKPDLGKTIVNCSMDGEKAFKAPFKKQLSYSEFTTAAQKCLDIVSLTGKPMHERNTAAILLKQIYVFRMADTLKESFNELLKEKNVLSIDDTNTILKDIIASAEAPFIYEKTGTRYKHFLLDEFQDTSNMQWDNFRPLLLNSIAEGFYNLIVGDVKQSIYRWRDADWKILGEKVEAQLDRTVEHPLDVNWRSAENIIDFNNSFYKSLAEHMGLADLYSDVKQQYAGKRAVPGCVDVTFCEKSLISDFVAAAVRDAHSRGFKQKDIAVIVRTNAEGGTMAARLLAEGFKVVTSDSLRISNGRSVREVVSALFKLDNPEDKINTSLAPDFDFDKLSAARSLSEMADALLKQLPREQLNADTLYVLAFLDLIRDFADKYGNSLHSFLEYWKEDGIKKSISSPGEGDAVTIITIHRCKGLAFPCVILPFPRDNKFMKAQGKTWEMPDVGDSALSDCENALYHIPLEKGTAETLFAKRYAEEKAQCSIDSINTWYVAMTRPKEELFIISPMPKKEVAAVTTGMAWTEVENIQSPLYMYISADNPVSENGVSFQPATPLPLDATWDKLEDDEEEVVESSQAVRFVYGEHAMKEKSSESQSRGTELKYLPDGENCEVRGTVRISNDSAEFFLGDESLGKRRRGTALHAVMENIRRPEDLHKAVTAAVDAGKLHAEDAEDAEKMIASAMEKEAWRNWFPEDLSIIRDERDVIDPLGADERPDRVLLKPEGVEIVDYKFGNMHPGYIAKMKSYIRLYKRMGYKTVSAWLWFVERGEVVPVVD